jgi:ubiquinone/menaquinone biosynthesis C-methylase UbiE
MPTDMMTSSLPPAEAEGLKPEEVERYFCATASYWRDIYDTQGLLSVIYRHRHQAALDWVEALKLPPGARVLEIGCGAGLMTAALAQHGYFVEAIDCAAEMVEMTRRTAEAAGAGARVAVSLGDAHGLRFPSGRFALVVALGVTPWLHSPAVALAETARVLEPGGHLIATADNRARLSRLLDPLSTPPLAPLRLAAKHLLRVAGWRKRGAGELNPKMHYPRQLDRMVAAAGLRKMAGRAVGFGPFTLLSHTVLPAAAGLALHRRLQALADRGVPFLRSTGCHYLLLAQKPAL